MEFWFCSIKILTIISVVILGIVLDLGAVTGERIGFRYWVEPGRYLISLVSKPSSTDAS